MEPFPPPHRGYAPESPDAQPALNAFGNDPRLLRALEEYDTAKRRVLEILSSDSWLEGSTELEPGTGGRVSSRSAEEGPLNASDFERISLNAIGEDLGPTKSPFKRPERSEPKCIALESCTFQIDTRSAEVQRFLDELDTRTAEDYALSVLLEENAQPAVVVVEGEPSEGQPYTNQLNRALANYDRDQRYFVWLYNARKRAREILDT